MTSLAGRLDDVFRHAPELDHVERAAQILAASENDIIWTEPDLIRLRKTISNLDAVGARIERKLQQ